MISTSFLADIALKSAVILAAAVAIAPLLRRASAATRHMSWTLALVAVMLLPVLKAGLPDWAPPGSNALLAAGTLVAGWRGAAPTAPVTDRPAAAQRASAHGGGLATPSSPRRAKAGRGATADPGAGARMERSRTRDRTALPASSEGAAVPSTPTRGEAPGPDPVPADEIGGGAVGQVAAASALSATRRAGRGLARWLLAVWLLGVAAVVTRTLVGMAAVRRIAAASRRVHGGRVADTLTELAHEAAIPVPRLFLAPDNAMPMAWGVLTPSVALPTTAEGWSTQRLRAVLRHELAHLRRRDPLTQWIADAVCALHWFNPFAWHAAGRLRDERELACDDEVLARTRRASDYAEELLQVARTMRAGLPSPALPMARATQLAKRVHAVLDGDRNRTPLRRTSVVVGLVGVALLVSPLAAASPFAATQPGDTPGDPAGGDAPAAAEGRDAEIPRSRDASSRPAPDSGDDARAQRDDVRAPTDALPQEACWEGDWRGSRTHNANDDQHRVRWRSGDCELDLRLEGEVRFNDALDGIAYLGPDARFRLREDDRDLRRELEAVPARDGSPVYTYRYAGRETVFDADARRWFARIVLQLARNSGFGAEQRVASLLRQGGPDAVFAEIGLLGGDWVRSVYFTELIEQARLTPGQVVRALQLAGSRIDSDHYVATVAGALVDAGPMSAEGRTALVSTVQGIDSDHYRAEILGRAMRSGALGVRGTQALLEAVGHIDSDHYTAEMLVAAIETQELAPGDRDEVIRIVRSMDSDHYRAEVLLALLDGGGQGVQVAVAMALPDAMESGHYIAEVAERLVVGGLTSAEAQRAFVRIVASTDSDHYRAEMLRAFLDASAGDPESLATVVIAARTLESDHYLADVLEAVADRGPLEGALRDAFMETMESIDSETYYGRVSRRVGRR
ncbi:MAG TPA: M56 family metallopeptidase [Longimicrobiales bacterium]|nr:M56 family metallopeptidase [Longimicrobiales bacterium]